MTYTRLTADQVRRRCDPASFPFENTAELAYNDDIIGQPRATRAIDFGIQINAPGYNLFMVGAAGTGRTTTIQRYLQKHAPTESAPSDWIYVHNFADAYRPIALQMKLDTARNFGAAIDAMMVQVQHQLPRVFESEEYDQARDGIQNQLDQFVSQAYDTLQQAATAKHFVLKRTPTGPVILPGARGKPYTDKYLTRLAKRQRTLIDKAQVELDDKLGDTLRSLREAERQAMLQLSALDEQVALAISKPLIEAVATQFTDQLNILQPYLDAFLQDLINNVAVFKPAENAANTSLATIVERTAILNRYRVNVFVDNCATCGAPVIVEDNPTYYNLIGRIDRNVNAAGMVTTDHTLMRPGALHRANGGYLVIRASDIFREEAGWQALKRCLMRKEICIEEQGQRVETLTSASLNPQHMPLRVKVILMGGTDEYWGAYHNDEDFRTLFKAKAEFGYQMLRDTAGELAYAQFIRARGEEEGLLPFDRTAVAEMVELGSRHAADQERLSTYFSAIADIARESSFWAKRANRDIVTSTDVRRAQTEYHYRLSLAEERHRERILRGRHFIQTSGEEVGQINGLSVYDYDEFEFAEPCRITARTLVGRAGINDIDRTVNLTDSSHNKGIAIIESYLGSLYSIEQSLQLTANITFEQSGAHGGDSASVALLCAMLSAVGNIPIYQDIALTGTLDQFGHVQPIGAVNTKIEGYFDICKARGLDPEGKHTVLIPQQNAIDLMLRHDVVEAVREGKFHVVTITHVSDAIDILMGMPAGERDEQGHFPKNTVHQIVEAALKDMNDKLDGKRKNRDDNSSPSDDDKRPEPVQPKPPDPLDPTPPPPDPTPTDPPTSRSDLLRRHRT